MEGITCRDHFVPGPVALYNWLNHHMDWDSSMAARKTASVGVAYNYAQMAYPYRPMPAILQELAVQTGHVLGFVPNNCLVNFYADGRSKMGFHSDQTDILLPGTGVAIVSLGAERVLRFRNIKDKSRVHDFLLSSGSLFYMTQEVQLYWQHAIPASDTDEGRMSLTFRAIR